MPLKDPPVSQHSRSQQFPLQKDLHVTRIRYREIASCILCVLGLLLWLSSCGCLGHTARAYRRHPALPLLLMPQLIPERGEVPPLLRRDIGIEIW